MLTRRQALELAAGAYLVAMLGHVRSSRAAGLDPPVPDYLRREPWLPLHGGMVEVAGLMFRLDGVADLPQLAGRDDAFRLEFTGQAGALAGGTHLFRQATLGSFVMFIAPVDRVVGTEQGYEVVIDRSVRVSAAVPTATSTLGAPTNTSAPPSARPGTAPPSPRRHPRTRRHRAHRHRRRRHRTLTVKHRRRGGLS